MIESELKKMFGEYLYYSYIYYKHATSLISDEEYDIMCHTLLEYFDKFKHRYKNLITIDDLNAGTGFAIHYPPDLINYYENRYATYKLEFNNEGFL